MTTPIFYINDNYTEATQLAMESAGIKMPEMNIPYTIRSVYLHKDVYHLLLNEIENQKIGMIEPGFAYHRFTDVPDNVLNWETVNDIFKQQNK